MKTTRRIYFGWKYGASGRLYALASPSKDGDTHVKDVERELPLPELLDLVKGKK